MLNETCQVRQELVARQQRASVLYKFIQSILQIEEELQAAEAQADAMAADDKAMPDPKRKILGQEFCARGCRSLEIESR